MFCDFCKCDVKCIKQHNLSNKHIKNAKIEPQEKKKYKYDGMKEYLNNYYVNKKINEKYKEKVKCVECDKYISKYNLSHHKATKKHIIKTNAEKLLDHLNNNYNTPDEVELN